MKRSMYVTTPFFAFLQRKLVNVSAKQALPSAKNLMRMIISTEDDEIDCAKAFDLMHQYGDLVDSGQNAGEILSAVMRHIEICRDCREELEALLLAIRSRAFFAKEKRNT